MVRDPRTLFDLKKLFVDPDMFESRESFRDAGFDVLDRSSDNKIMVASHEVVRGYLFKKYCADISLDEQLENYERRVEGVRELQAFIDKHDLRHVVVPKKWLCELPSAFASRKQSSYVLVVEELKVLNSDETQRRYHRIDEDVLEELCRVVFAFRGLDSNSKNVPFTEDGRIAFIDTEHWDRHWRKKKSKKPYLRHIEDYLSDDGRKMAKKMFEELEDDDDDDDDE